VLLPRLSAVTTGPNASGGRSGKRAEGMERLALAGAPAVTKSVGKTVDQAVDKTVETTAVNGPAAVLNNVLDTVLAEGVAAAVASDDTGNFLKREHARFEDLCPSCRHSGETLMCMVDIPHFKEVSVSPNTTCARYEAELKLSVCGCAAASFVRCVYLSSCAHVDCSLNCVCCTLR
jgi:ZPR1 zinc-finger domain